MKTCATSLNSFVKRADELFEQHRQEIFRSTDHLFARLMLVQWLAGVMAALFISPRTWAGQSSEIHIHVWAAIFIGGAISLFPIWMAHAWPGAAITRHVMAVAQMLMSALLIDLTGGRIETHFHVFGSLVVLSFYRDWRVLIPATIVVGLDHFLRGIYWPYSVYGVLSASPWRSIEHAGWVAFEDIFLVISCLRGVREMRFVALRTADIEASEQSFRQIFEEAPIGMAVVGLDKRYMRANGRFCQMLGYSEQELKERTASEITFPEDIELSRQITEALLNGEERFATEKRYVCKNKEVLWSSVTACMVRDENRTPRHYLAMVEDISLRIGQRRAEALHRAILDSALDCIITMDASGRVLEFNPAAERVLGFTRAEVVGKELAELIIPPALREKHRQELTHYLNTGKGPALGKRIEMTALRRDGSEILVELAINAFKIEGAPVFTAYLRDLTEQKKAAAALEQAKDADRANKAKSEFLSRMSHELRTPLNAILGFGQLLERQSPTDIQRTRVRHITSAGRHLLHLINEVLDISRIEAGRLDLSLEPVCLGEALTEALELILPLAAERSIELSTPSPLDRSCFVLTDRQRFKQVLLNLMSNAVKYTSIRGKVTISYSSSGKDALRIVVSDTGAGIPGDKLARLFTPFDRLGAEQSTVEGTGLGLALSQRLMHAMGGSIGASSTLGRGSTFWIELPCAESPLERIPSPETDTPDRESLSLTAKRKILYIEDNLSNLTLVEEILRDQPEIELIGAMQGQLGLDLARKHSPDLILLDLHLPDLPGWEVLAQLRRDEATRGIPVVVISADATARQTKRLMAAGAHAYLTKPLDVTEFFRVVEETTLKSAAA